MGEPTVARVAEFNRALDLVREIFKLTDDNSSPSMHDVVRMLETYRRICSWAIAPPQKRRLNLEGFLRGECISQFVDERKPGAKVISLCERRTIGRKVNGGC